MYPFLYYTLINTPFIASLFWIAMILRSPCPKNRTRRVVLLAYMVNVAFLMFATGAFFQPSDKLFSVAKVIQIGSLVNCFPLYFMYIKLITSNVKFNPKHLLGLLPGVILSILTFILIRTSSPTQLAEIYNTFQHGHTFSPDNSATVKALAAIDITATVIIILSTVFMLLNIRKSMESYKAALKQYYADDQSKVRGLGVEVVIGAFFTIIAVSGSLFGGIDAYQYSLVKMFFAVFLASVPIFVVGYHSQFVDFNIADFQKEVEKGEEGDKGMKKETVKENIAKVAVVEEEVSLSDINLNYLAERIVDVVESKKMYLNPELRITDISNELSTNRTYISQAINHKLGGNFSDFINNYRIDHTKKLLTDPERQNFTIEAIAEESGYATVASLNRLFKLKTGMTPNQYRQVNYINRTLKQ